MRILHIHYKKTSFGNIVEPFINKGFRHLAKLFINSSNFSFQEFC